MEALCGGGVVYYYCIYENVELNQQKIIVIVGVR